MSSSVKVMRARRGTAAGMWPMSKLRIGGMEMVDIGEPDRGGRAAPRPDVGSTAQNLRHSRLPGGARDAHRSCHPQSLSAVARLPAAAAVRSRATVDACPPPSAKPRHAHSPDRLPVNFSENLRNSWERGALTKSRHLPPQPGD